MHAFGAGFIALLMLAWSIWRIKRKKGTQTTFYLMFIAGLSGVGIFADQIKSASGSTLGMISSTTSSWFSVTGAGVGFVIAWIMFLELKHIGHPKKGAPPATWHVYGALAAAPLWSACGSIWLVLMLSLSSLVGKAGGGLLGLLDSLAAHLMRSMGL